MIEHNYALTSVSSQFGASNKPSSAVPSVTTTYIAENCRMHCLSSHHISRASHQREYGFYQAALSASVTRLSYRIENSHDKFLAFNEWIRKKATKRVSNRRPEARPLHPKRKVYHDTLQEICDSKGVWHTGWLTFGKLADVIGTTTTDLMRRLVALGVLEHDGQRHRLTSWSKGKCYGEVYRKRKADGARLEIDVILPEGMVLLVQNLEQTNLPVTEAESLSEQGLSQRAIATRLGISQPAVKKRLDSIPPRLSNWPVVGSWD